MEPIIQDYLRVGLTAMHSPTSTTVNFPQIHILVEKFQENGIDRFYATCLEYSQGFEEENPEKAVVGLIDFMFKYFFSVIKKEGKEFLYQQAEDPENNLLWNKVRRFLVQKYSNDLHFVEQTYKGVSKEELLKIAATIKKDPLGDSFVSKEDHESIVNHKNSTIENQQKFINDILALVEKQKKAIEELASQNMKLKSGLEASMEWEECNPQIQRAIVAN